MLRLLALLSFLLLTLSKSPVRASPCICTDADFNLLAFGFQGKDWNAGTEDAWTTSTTATDITTTGRPPFDGTNTTCYLAQFFNAIYIINGDAKNPNSIYIYDAGAKSWSTQLTTPGSFNYASFEAILDHDTNLFYALSNNNNMYSLDMGTMKAATSKSIPWTLVQSLDLGQGYSPVMALAQNHIHFLDVPNTDSGEAKIFVIHFSYFQPETQSYPTNGSSTPFPHTHGQTTSLFMDTGVQQEFVFIPDTFTGTYVINVENNSTQMLPPPPVNDTKSTYTASDAAILQLDSAGNVHFFSYTPGDSDANSERWKSVNALASVATPQSSGSSTSSSQQVTNTSTPSNKNPSGMNASTSGGTLSNYAVTSGLVGLAVLFAILGFL